MKPEMMKNIAVALMATKALAASRDNLSDEDATDEVWNDFAVDLGDDERTQETQLVLH